ncbi:hypothetical protein BDV59DRAFT_177610 [Aspergillus ambiguus]|uniref:uncharacterized protein n=1 Tax=Aspergillus ambiguus TaxID=176160 RepID=UPI003CCDB033
MSNEVGAKALSGEFEWISNHSFKIKEQATMIFEGGSCNISDAAGNLVEKLGKEHGKVQRRVYKGYRCYVMSAWIKLEK